MKELSRRSHLPLQFCPGGQNKQRFGPTLHKEQSELWPELWPFWHAATAPTPPSKQSYNGPVGVRCHDDLFQFTMQRFV